MKAKFGRQSKQVNDLRVELKRLMFTATEKNPLPVANDTSKFTMLMSAFNNYEKMVCLVEGRGYARVC